MSEWEAGEAWEGIGRQAAWEEGCCGEDACGIPLHSRSAGRRRLTRARPGVQWSAGSACGGRGRRRASRRAWRAMSSGPRFRRAGMSGLRLLAELGIGVWVEYCTFQQMERRAEVMAESSSAPLTASFKSRSERICSSRGQDRLVDVSWKAFVHHCRYSIPGFIQCSHGGATVSCSRRVYAAVDHQRQRRRSGRYRRQVGKSSDLQWSVPGAQSGLAPHRKAGF